MTLESKGRLGGSTVLLVLIAACSGSSSDDTGTVSISLMDRPVDNVTELNVTISEIWLKSRGDGPAFELEMTESPITVNLLALTDENAALLVDNAVVPAGSYNWLEMMIEDDDISESYAMTDTGGMFPVEVDLRVPSGRIRLVSGFEVGANQGVKFLFDWDVRKGLTDPVGQDGYILKPAFRVLEVQELAAVSGTATTATLSTEDSCDDDDANLDVGNIAYIFEGLGVIPNEIDGVAPEPITTVEAVLNDSDGYDYRAVLMPGDYTVAFTCEGKNDTDAAEGNIEFLITTHSVTLAAGDDEIDLDF